MLVALLGSSSLAAGAPLPAALASAWECEVRADGRVGWSPARWSAELEADGSALEALTDGASVLVVYLPANGAPSSAAVERLDNLLRSRVAVPVVWLRAPPFPASSPHAGRIERWDAAIVEAGVVTLGRAPPLRSQDVRADGLHLQPSGAYHLARTTRSPLGTVAATGAGGGSGLVLAVAVLALLVWATR